MTGEPVPNPFRTWKNDFVDTIPIILMFAAVFLIAAAGPIYAARAKEVFAKVIEHLRTPVK